MDFDPAKYTASSREAWSETARTFADENAPRLEPYGNAMLEMLDLASLRPGAWVLDLCSGPGEPALTIAKRLGRRVRVTGTDLAPEMVRLADEAARVMSLTNVEFKECDAQQLPFAPSTFDLVTCRFGLMLVAEPPRVAREVARVLRDGGRFGCTVWSERSKDSPVWSLRQVATEVVPEDLLPAGPDIYQWGNRRNLAALLEEAGLAVRRVESVTSAWNYASPEDYWRSMTRGSPMGRTLSKLPRELTARVEEEVKRRLTRLQANGGLLALDAEALVAVAQKG